jgi:DNA-binding transcriptional LysR family regulator
VPLSFKAGEELAAVGLTIESQVESVERRIFGGNMELPRSIRITTLDSFLVGLLNPVFHAFQAKHPQINLEIALSNQLFSL